MIDEHSDPDKPTTYEPPKDGLLTGQTDGNQLNDPPAPEQRNSVGISFATLEKICKALECDPGDVLKITGSGKKGSGATGGAQK